MGDSPAVREGHGMNAEQGPIRGRMLPMAGASARPERRDAAENRQHILAAARRLFAEHGVAAVSMDEIARIAGVGKGTLYRRYAHKGLLCIALLDENTRQMQEAALAALRDDKRPILDQLGCLLGFLFAHNEQNAELLGAVSDAAAGRRRGEIYQSPPYRWQRLMIVGLLRRANATRECAPFDIDYLADAILAPLDIDLYLFQRHTLGMSPERIVEGARRLILDGLRARG
jgi:AcrR family transcriptional regulator